jgi:hypothetical protein
LTGGSAVVRIKDGIAHYVGVETCGRVWLCPVCSAKIRARRGDEIAEAVGRWLAAGGFAFFVTATLPHEHGDALRVTLDILTKCWRALMSGKAYQIEKSRYGIAGNIKALEITHGIHGWHPHIHAVVLVENEIEFFEMVDWYSRLDHRWSSVLVRNNWAPGKPGVRLKLDPITRGSSRELAAYVTKVQDNGLGNEIARADLKRGRKSSRTPFQILADFGTDGLSNDLALWLEFEQATQHRNAIRYSPGLRKRLLPDVDEQSDDEIAAEEIGGDDFVHLLPHVWYRLTAIPGATAAVLDAIEADGWEGLIRTLVAYRVDTEGGVLTPEEWRHVSGLPDDH